LQIYENVLNNNDTIVLLFQNKNSMTKEYLQKKQLPHNIIFFN